MDKISLETILKVAGFPPQNEVPYGAFHPLIINVKVKGNIPVLDVSDHGPTCQDLKICKRRKNPNPEGPFPDHG